jgi:bifunctional non-homologous end joining protein LigD
VIPPILARRSRVIPAGKEWRYEVKLDGFRGLLYVENGKGFFRSKTNRLMRRFDYLANELAQRLPVDAAIFDGEIVALRNSLLDFKALMFARGRAQYAAFDLMWLNGLNLCSLPYKDRKRRLKKLISAEPYIGYVDSYTTASLFEDTQRLDLEGIVAKRVSDPYDTSAQWLKIKHPGYSQMEGRHELFSRNRNR